jgi:hypothetical protein
LDTDEPTEFFALGVGPMSIFVEWGKAIAVIGSTIVTEGSSLGLAFCNKLIGELGNAFSVIPVR